MATSIRKLLERKNRNKNQESEIKIIFAKVDVLIWKEAKNYIYQIIVEKLSVNKSIRKLFIRGDYLNIIEI